MNDLVFIVDDDAGVRSVLRDILHLLNYEVLEAINGKDALDKLTENVPWLILLDSMMPEMDGVAFVQELRRRHLFYPIVACSASSTVASFAAAIGAIGVLPKPFHLAQVRRVLAQQRTIDNA